MFKMKAFESNYCVVGLQINNVPQKVYLLSGFTFFLLAGYLLIFFSINKTHHEINAAVELVGAVLGILAGSAFLTMFFSLGRVIFIFIGLAFFINGSEGFLHSIFMFLVQNSENVDEVKKVLVATSAIGHILMALLLILAPYFEKKVLTSNTKLKSIFILVASVISVSLILNVLLFIKPITLFLSSISIIERPYDLLSALLFLVSAFIYFRIVSKSDTIIIWLLLSIMVLFISQSLISFSNQISDSIFSISHFYHVLAYIFPLVGFAQFQVSVLLNQRETERKLRESRERHEMALYGGELGTWDWLVDSGDVSFNKRWAEMIGYELNEIEPNVSSWEKLVHPDDMPEVMKVLTAHLERKTEYYQTTHRVKHKDGSWVWVLDKGKVIKRDEEGNPLRATGTHLDVTQQKLAEDALKRERDLFATGPVVLFLWKNEEHWPIEYVSENVEQVLGYSVNDLISAKVIYENIVHPDDLQRVSEEVVKYSEKKVKRFEHQPYRLITKDKREIWVSDYSNIIYGQDGEVTHFMGYILDVTQKRKAELLELETEKLRIANQMAATLAHEFNNPLAIIKGNVEMAKMVEIPAERAQQNNETILKQIERMKDLVSKLLELDELNEIHYAGETKILDLTPRKKEQ